VLAEKAVIQALPQALFWLRAGQGGALQATGLRVQGQLQAAWEASSMQAVAAQRGARPVAAVLVAVAQEVVVQAGQQTL